MILTDTRPIELFGWHTDKPCNPNIPPWSDLIAETAATPFKKVTCPYRQATSDLFAHTPTASSCDKIRKAKPNPLIGNCIVRKSSAKKAEDWIVCPSRFLQDKVIFDDCKRLLTPAASYAVVRELAISSDGSLDFGVASLDASGEIVDFVGIEVQACGTGGSGPIWDARNDFLSGKLRKDYSFSLNEKDASKKILVQLLHKARQIARWRKNTVLVIQDVFLAHLRKAYNVDAHFHKQDPQDFVHIHSYKLIENAGQFTMKLNEALSTDMVGLSMALISNPGTNYSKFEKISTAVGDRIKAKQFVGL